MAKKNEIIIENTRLERAKVQVVGIDRQRLGIGTLKEKSMHAILKLYYSPDENYHEKRIGRYVADIFTGDEILEIQTRQFNAMRKKLDVFLGNYPVTIIHPIPRYKWLYWINVDTGEISKPRKSNATGNVYKAFLELYKIKMYLKNPNLHFKFVLMDMDEYKLLNGWSYDKKRGSVRYDRIPVNIIEEIDICQVEDFMRFVPSDLEEFTSKDFAKSAKINVRLAQVVLNILTYVECIEKIGKSGRSNLYKPKEW